MAAPYRIRRLLAGGLRTELPLRKNTPMKSSDPFLRFCVRLLAGSACLTSFALWPTSTQAASWVTPPPTERVSPLSVVAQSASLAQSQQGASLIPGVPFVSLATAKQLNYVNKDILNPAIAAAQAANIKYWGEDLKLLSTQPGTPGTGWAGWSIEGNNAKSIEEIKPWLNRRIPVVVYTAITPVAHTLFRLAPVMAQMGVIPAELTLPRGPLSGMLGVMVPLDVFPQIQKAAGVRLLTESVTGSSRIVIGYDDKRRVVLMHDATFGPAWEVSYDDFDRFWEPSGRSYSVIRPSKDSPPPSSHTAGGAYAARTPDQRAAEAYVMGYGLSAAGKPVDSQAKLRQGLAIPGISTGMQHLLQLELGVELLETNSSSADGIMTIQKAITLLPENPMPYVILANRYSQEGRTQQAAEARQQSERLCNSQENQAILIRKLPADLNLVICNMGYF